MVSIVIAAYNEAEALTSTVEEIHATFNASHNAGEYEIVVVDDGSADATAEVAVKAGARIVRHPHNLGYGYALKSGIKCAKFETIVIMDADFTYPATVIPVLLEEYFNNGADMVVGARSGQVYEGGPIKGSLRILLKLLVEFTAGRKVPDVNSGLRVFNRQTIYSYLAHLCGTFSFTTTLTLAYMMTGKFVTFVPIDYRKRVGRSKVMLFRDSLRTLQYLFQSINYYNPIKLYLLLSISALCIGICAAMISAIFSVTASIFILVISFMTAMILFAFGLIADLLRQIMNKSAE